MDRAWRRVALAAALAQQWSGAAAAPASPPALKLREDGTFKLALFCDMHYGEKPATDERSSEFQRTMLELEQPDLVVVDGDSSSNYAAPPCGAGNASICREWYAAQWRNWTRPLEESRTPYAYTLGNHDRIPGLHMPAGGAPPGIETSYAVPDRWIMEMDQTNPHSLSKLGPASIHGASNYVLPIAGPDGRRAAYIWLVDSSDDACMGAGRWGCVYADQVEWYRQTSKQLIAEDGRVLPGLMFHHIPLEETVSAWDDPEVEINGTNLETIACPTNNTGLFEAVREIGNVWGIFHGHNHNVDFIAKYKGIFIGFGRKSAFGGYGGELCERPGSRMFKLRPEADGTATWHTWIREMNGTRVVQQPAVNRTPQGSMAATERLRSQEMDPMEAAIHACRTFDDKDACRAATGLDSLRATAPQPEGAAIFA